VSELGVENDLGIYCKWHGLKKSTLGLGLTAKQRGFELLYKDIY